MADEVITVSGLREVQQLLEDPDLLIDGFEQALIAGSVPIQQGLRDRLPQRKTPISDGKREFPPLAESIVTVVRVDKEQRSGRASTGFGESGPVALWNEYGHRIVTHDGTDTGERTAPNPVMHRTAAAVEDAVVEAFADSLASHLRSRLSNG